jgi:hypothetical protein
MNASSVVYPRARIRTRADHASTALLRSVMADGWRPEKAARELLVRVRGDRRLLRLIRARLSRATLERPTTITDRAMTTLDLALATPVGQPTVGTASFPLQGGGHA